jgi:hypothetical protein
VRRTSLFPLFCRVFLTLSGLLPGIGLAQASPYCLEKGIASFEFSGLTRVPLSGDLCKTSGAQLSSEVREVLETIGKLHRQVAEVLGTSFSQTYSPGITIAFRGSSAGWMESYALKNGEGLEMRVPLDWTLGAEFPSRVYVHELVHVLAYRNRGLGASLVGLVDHPLITEGLMDLVAMEVHDDPVMTFGGKELPSCLRVNRDASRTRSLEGRFGDFYTFASGDRVRACCASLGEQELGAQARAICDRANESSPVHYYAGMKALGADLNAVSAKDLDAPFRFEACHFNIRGWGVLQGCGSHVFAEPLVSFFRGLKQEFGRSFVRNWLQALRRESERLITVSCRYRGDQSGAKASLVQRGVLPSLMSLKQGMGPLDQERFEKVWKTHGFSLLERLDFLYLEKTRESRVFPLLVKESPGFSRQNRCISIYAFDPQACAIECLGP